MQITQEDIDALRYAVESIEGYWGEKTGEEIYRISGLRALLAKLEAEVGQS